MPGLAQQRIDNQFTNGGGGSSLCSLSCSNGSVSGNGFWSKHRDDVSYNKLQKFWSELSPQARQKLLRINKQAFFEQARKNMYCSRCQGLLMEGYNQIQLHGKALQEEGAGGKFPCIKQGSAKYQNGDLGLASVCQMEVQDPSVHPWGGLAATKDSRLTLLNCYLYSASLKGLQNVFDSARARERERELLYPDACGGGGRGWISQGMVGYGRGHGNRESCALHNARLSVDTLVDFWSALGEETRQSLLKMKEDDFIERLMFRFDSKRFCRDCRRNVIREFKELKELKRMRREPRCTSWFCVADSAFEYEVSHDTIQADWHQTFIDNVGKYRYFEWGVGTGEGKCDILEFENVGMSGRVQVNGLDLGGLNACYITLRACRMDGRCSEYSVKAHALKGQQCVHCRLVVGDGFVTITRGESIRRFFEHAEEAEEEEDDDSVDKDGNDLDGECSRPQKHAKSPELAREFLLDAATVIFKEQVEKAFREGTARQNAHSIFVCLALKLLEDRVHVACKEITTLEKQMKLLEEEEKEKREEEERKERRKTKEKEKKLRRKERLRIKEKDRENRSSESDQSNSMVLDDLKEEDSPTVEEDEHSNVTENGNMICESSQSQDEQPLNDSAIDNMQNHSDDCPDGEVFNVKEEDKDSFYIDHSSKVVSSHRQQPHTAKEWSDRRRFAVVSDNRGGMVTTKAEHNNNRHHGEISLKSTNGFTKQLRSNPTKPSSTRNCGSKFGERYNCVNNRAGDRYDFSACSCNNNNQHSDYRAKGEINGTTTVTRLGRDTKSHHSEPPPPPLDSPKPYYRGHNNYQRENCGRSKSKITTGNHPQYIKKVWEPMESQRKVPRSNSDTDVAYKVKDEKPPPMCSGEIIKKSDETCHKDTNGTEENGQDIEIPPPPVATTPSPSKETTHQPMSIASSSDNCSSCLSEGDNNTCSSNSPNAESLSSSDSDDTSQQLERRETPLSSSSNNNNNNSFSGCQEAGKERTQVAEEGEGFQSRKSHSPNGAQGGVFSTNYHPVVKVAAAQSSENGRGGVVVNNMNMGPQHQTMLSPAMHNPAGGMPYQMFQAPAAVGVGYYHQNPVAWPAGPAVPFPPPNHYIFPSPYGYGGNSRFIPSYGGELQHHHHGLPMVNPGQVPPPIYQPVLRANHMHHHPKDHQVKISQPYGGVQRMQVAAAAGEMKPPAARGADDPVGRHHPMEALLPNGERNGNSDKNNSGFSLFHFGGPLALSSPEQGKAGSVEEDDDHHQQQQQSNSKKDDIEEYNLFAASNGIKFSFF